MNRFFKSFLSVMAVALTSWTWAAELVIPYTFDGKTGNTEYAYEYKVKMPSEALTSFTTTIRYSGGSHRVEILGVKLLDGETTYTAVATGTEGTEVAGTGSYSGGNNYHNIFTFTNEAGFTANKVYTLQANLKVTDNPPSHRGNIKVSGGITLYIPPYSFGVNFTTSGNENISTTEGAGFSKGTYAKPTNWGNFTGSASGNGTMTVENQTIKVYWTARGIYNSSADISTDDGKLLHGYLDDAVYGGRTKATVTITGLPSDKQYAVAVILAGDNGNNTDFNGLYSPALINGETYSYVDGTLVKGDAAKADNAKTWGDRRKSDGTTGGPTTPTEGQNVMFVEGLSGSILTITSAMDAQDTSRLTIAGVQVWTTEDAPVAPAAPTDKEVVSLNFYSSQGSVSGEAGLVAAQGWENLAASGTETTLAVWNGEEVVDYLISLTYSAKNGHQYTGGVTDNYIKGYLDDGDSQAQVTVENIPFEEYSVIVYAATDEDARKFKPVLINDSYYAGVATPTAYGYADLVLEGEKNLRSWGGSRNAVAAYGKNALRVDGLSGNLTIKGGSNGDGARGGIAAIQIINTGSLTNHKEVITVDGVKYDYVFRGTTDASWDTLANWYTGICSVDGDSITYEALGGSKIPCAPDSDLWGYALLDGNRFDSKITAGEDGYKTVTASTLEGWNPKYTVCNGVHLKITRLYKIQGAAVKEWRVDDTSKITVGEFRNSDGGIKWEAQLTFYVNNIEGVDFVGENKGATYYFDDNGSVKMDAVSGTQTIAGVKLDLGSADEGRKIVSRKLIGFTDGDATFNVENCTVTTTDANVTPMALDTLQEVGQYKFEKKNDGYYVTYVAYAGLATYKVLKNGQWGWKDNVQPRDEDAVIIDFTGVESVTTVGAAILPEGVARLTKLVITGENASVAAELLACADTIVAEGAWSLVGGVETPVEIAGVISGAGQVKIAEGQVKFTNANAYTGGTFIGEGATLTISHANALSTLGTITGAGTLVCDRVVPANMSGLDTGVAASDETLASGWTGTVCIMNVTGSSSKGAAELNIDAYCNNNSKLTLDTVTGWVASGTAIKNLRLEGDGFAFSNGSSSGYYTVTVDNLSGDGAFTGATGGNWKYKLVVKNVLDFTGSIDLTGNNSGGTSFVIADDATNAAEGTIVVAKSATIAVNQTWTAVNGIKITDNGSLTISEATALPVNKPVFGAGALVINGTVDLSGFTGALTCKLEVATGATVTITQAQAEAFASIEVNEGGSLKVIVAGKDIPYTANVTGEGSVNIILANGTVLSDTATYKPALTGDCTWLEFLFEGDANNQRLANGGTFGEAIRGEDNGTWTFVDVGVTPARQALQIHDKYPWTNTAPNFRSLETWSASFFAKMPKTEGGVLIGFGSTQSNNKGFIALVRGKGKDKVLLVSGTEAPGNNVKKSYEILADFTVPNAETTYHLYTFVRTLTGVEIYLDGEPWTPYDKPVTVADGFQIGSLHGGFCSAGGTWKGFVYSGELTDYTGLTLTRGGSESDTNGAVDMLRIYRFALSADDVQALASEYTYVSPEGSYSRTIAENAEWVTANAWTNDLNASTVEEPLKGSVTLSVNAENALAMTINVSENRELEALTLQGDNVQLVGAKASKKLSVKGLTKVLCDATIDCNVVEMAGPVRVASGKTLTLNISEALLASVVQNAVIGKYTYHLTGSAEGNVVIDNASETYNGWSVEIEQDDTKSWVLTMIRANWYVSIDADNVTTWRAGNTVETAEEAAAPEMSTNQPIYVSVIGDASVTLPSGRTDNVTVSGSGRVTLNASANGTTIGALTINDTAMAAVTPALAVDQKTVTEAATLGYAATSEVWTISSALSGSTKLEIVSGTVKLTALNGGYDGQITVAEGATLASGTGATCPFGKGAIVNDGTVILSAGQLPPTSGSGNVTINGSGGSGETSTKIAGPLTINGILSVSEGVTCALDRNGTDFSESPYVNGPSVQINGTVNVGTTVTDGYITIAAGKKLSGAGTIGTPLTLANGAIIDATNGAVTATAAVTCEGIVTVKVANYGDVLKASGLNAEKFELQQNPLAGNLLATSDALVYAPVIPPAGGDAVSDAVMAEVARAAGAEEVTTITAVLPDKILDANKQEILEVDVNGAELFNNVISFKNDGDNQGAKIAVVSYLFGISDITVNAEGKIVVKASVDRIEDNSVALIDGEGEGETVADPVKPTFANGVTVKLYNGTTKIGTATVNVDNASEIEITSTNDLESILNPPVQQDEEDTTLPAPTSQTLQLTIKAEK